MQNSIPTSEANVRRLSVNIAQPVPKAVVAVLTYFPKFTLSLLRFLVRDGRMDINHARYKHKTYVPRRVWKRHGALLFYHARMHD